MKKWILGFVILVAACQPGPRPDTEPPQEVVEETAPAAVENLSATVVEGEIELTWDAVEGATGYRIFRVAKAASSPAAMARRKAPALRVSSEAYASVTKPSHLDAAVEAGNVYTYRVAATNAVGEGPLSNKVTARIVSWLSAPVIASVVSIGGNAGLSTTTEISDAATAYGGCGEIGVGVASIRPAERTPLGGGMQTFSVVLGHNPDPDQGGYFDIMAYSDAGPLYSNGGYLDTCGLKTVTFTVDLDKVVGYIGIDIYTSTSNYTFVYTRTAGPQVRIVSTTPAIGGTLTGGAPMIVEIDFANLPAGGLITELYSPSLDYTSFSENVTAVSGTGHRTVQLDYETACVAKDALVIVGFTDGALNVADAARYAMQNTDETYLVHWLPYDEYSLSELKAYEGFYEPLNVGSCSGFPAEITLTADVGYVIDRNFGEDLARTVSGTTDDFYSLTAESDVIAGWEYGSLNPSVTLDDGTNQIQRSIPITLTDLFWNPGLADTLMGQTSYPATVTAVHSPWPFVLLGVESENAYASSILTLADDVYTGNFEIPTCGDFNIAPSFGYLYGPAELVSVTSAADETLQATPAEIFQEVGAFPSIYQTTVALAEGCGKDFNWEVTGASTWIRLQNLSGTQDNLVLIGIAVEDVPWDGGFAEGQIQIETTAGSTLSIPVFVMQAD